MPRRPEPTRTADEITRDVAHLIAPWPDTTTQPGGAILDAMDPDAPPIRRGKTRE